MKLRIVVTVCAVVALAVGVATATAGKGKGGNSSAAKACQKGGWKNLVRQDGTVVKGAGAVVGRPGAGCTRPLRRRR